MNKLNLQISKNLTISDIVFPNTFIAKTDFQLTKVYRLND